MRSYREEPPQSREVGDSKIHTLQTAIALSLFNFVVCYFREFVSLDIPLLTWGDDVGFLNNATRIVAGRLPYRDYFAFLAPGTEVTYAWIVKGFGAHAWTPNLMVPLLFGIVAGLMTFIAAKLSNGASVALPALLLAGFILPGALDATHHWFSTITALSAVLVLLSGETTPYIASAGALCGLTALYTQSKGLCLALGFIAYLSLKGWRDGPPVHNFLWKCIVLLGAAILVFAAGDIYFVRAAGVGRWWYCLVVFPLKYYGTVDANNWHIYGHGFRLLSLAAIPFLFVHGLVPVIYGICIFQLIAVKNLSRSHRNAILLLTLTGIAMFLSVAAAPSWKRLSAVSAPGAILLTWLIQNENAVRPILRSGLAIVAIVLAGAGIARSQLRWSEVLDLPVGKAALIEHDRYEEYRYLMSRTQRGQYMFAPPSWLFALGVQNPAPIDLFGPFNYTRPEQISATIRALEQYRVPLLLLNRGMFKSEVDLSPVSDHLDPMRTYLGCQYRLTVTFQNDDQVWERVDIASAEVPDKGMERRRCVMGPDSISQPAMGGAR